MKKQIFIILFLLTLLLGISLFFSEISAQTDPNLISTNKGITYLRNQQQDNGSISGFSGITSWAAMAFASAGIDPNTVFKESTLMDYLAANKPATSSAATEWERDILAITSADKNPFDFDGVNYVENLETYHNNSQIGSVSAVNDDIFGLLALIAAGEGADPEIKENSLNFIIENQKDDGSYSWSIGGTSDIDTTSAALQALIAADSTGLTAPGLSESIDKTKDFLLNSQNSDGGFPNELGSGSNTSTTAWVTMAMSATGITGEKYNLAKLYIRSNQEENGSFKWIPDSSGESFTTSFAVIALNGKYWPINQQANSPTVTPSPTLTPTLSPTASPTVTPTPSPSVTPSISPTNTITPSPTPSGTANRILSREKIMKERELTLAKIRLFQLEIRKYIYRLLRSLRRI